MKQNNMLAMILAGGRGSRLHELTKKVAKPAVSYGGKYRIIDFPLSNCANSGIDVVGVLTQYESVLLNSYVETTTKLFESCSGQRPFPRMSRSATTIRYEDLRTLFYIVLKSRYPVFIASSTSLQVPQTLVLLR